MANILGTYRLAGSVGCPVQCILERNISSVLGSPTTPLTLSHSQARLNNAGFHWCGIEEENIQGCTIFALNSESSRGCIEEDLKGPFCGQERANEKSSPQNFEAGQRGTLSPLAGTPLSTAKLNR